MLYDLTNLLVINFDFKNEMRNLQENIKHNVFINYYLKSVFPKTGKQKFLLYSSIVFFIPIVILLYNSTGKPTSLLDILLITIFSSFLSASSIEYINLISKSIDVTRKQVRFSRLFGYYKENRKIQLKLPLILAEFNVDFTEKANESSMLNTITAKDLTQGGFKASVTADIIASSYIISAFSKLKLDIPKIVGEKYIEEIINLSNKDD